jgi:hypothetical protein
MGRGDQLKRRLFACRFGDAPKGALVFASRNGREYSRGHLTARSTTREETHEENLSTEQPEACPEARLSPQDVEPRGPGHHQGSAPPRPRAPVRLSTATCSGRTLSGRRLTARSRLASVLRAEERSPVAAGLLSSREAVAVGGVTDRGSFAELRHTRRRARSGAVAVS